MSVSQRLTEASSLEHRGRTASIGAGQAGDQSPPEGRPWNRSAVTLGEGYPSLTLRRHRYRQEPGESACGRA
jgi:hypothetical protein